MVLLWAVGNQGDLVLRLAALLLGVYCAAGAGALWRRFLPIPLVERMTFVILACFAYAILVQELYTNTDLAGSRLMITDTVYAFLTALFVIGFLIFERRGGLVASLVLYGLEVAIVASRMPVIMGRLSAGDVSWLIRMHAFMGAVIGLLYVFSYSKEQLYHQRAAAETFHRMAHTDQLTGAANRRKLYSELERELEKARRYERPLSVILFDLDHFKLINDTYGHDRGDAILQDVVRAVEPLLRGSDHLGRWGGEEFLVVAPETDLDQASQLAGRLRERLGKLGEASAVTASFGIAQYISGEDRETLLKRADEALYQAKESGRDCIEAAS